MADTVGTRLEISWAGSAGVGCEYRFPYYRIRWYVMVEPRFDVPPRRGLAFKAFQGIPGSCCNLCCIALQVSLVFVESGVDPFVDFGFDQFYVWLRSG